MVDEAGVSPTATDLKTTYAAMVNEQTRFNNIVVDYNNCVSHLQGFGNRVSPRLVEPLGSCITLLNTKVQNIKEKEEQLCKLLNYLHGPIIFNTPEGPEDQFDANSWLKQVAIILISIMIGVLGRGFYQEVFDSQTIRINECSTKLGQLSTLPDQLNTLEMSKNEIATKYQQCMQVQQGCFTKLETIRLIADVNASDDKNEKSADGNGDL